MRLVRHTSRTGNRRQGTALLEFVLALPVLLLLIGGLFDIGRGFTQAGVILNAAREGARYGIANPTSADRDEQIKTHVIEEASQSGVHIESDKISVLIPSGTDSGNPLTVQVVYQYQPLMAGVVGVQTTIKKQCTMIIF